MTVSVNPAKLAYSIPAAAEALSVCRVQVYRLINAGYLKTIKIGADLRIPAAEVQRLANEGCPKIPAQSKKALVE